MGRTVYDRRRYECGPNADGWRRVRDWNDYLMAHREACGECLDGCRQWGFGLSGRAGESAAHRELRVRSRALREQKGRLIEREATFNEILRAIVRRACTLKRLPGAIRQIRSGIFLTFNTLEETVTMLEQMGLIYRRFARDGRGRVWLKLYATAEGRIASRLGFVE